MPRVYDGGGGRGFRRRDCEFCVGLQRDRGVGEIPPVENRRNRRRERRRKNYREKQRRWRAFAVKRRNEHKQHRRPKRHEAHRRPLRFGKLGNQRRFEGFQPRFERVVLCVHGKVCRCLAHARGVVDRAFVVQERVAPAVELGKGVRLVEVQLRGVEAVFFGKRVVFESAGVVACLVCVVAEREIFPRGLRPPRRRRKHCGGNHDDCP